MSFAVVVVVVVVVIVGVDVVAGLLQVLMLLMATIFELGYIWIKSNILHYVCRLLHLGSIGMPLSLLACCTFMYLITLLNVARLITHMTWKKKNLTLNYKTIVCGVWDGW
jgi:hypothetical protein